MNFLLIGDVLILTRDREACQPKEPIANELKYTQKSITIIFSS